MSTDLFSVELADKHFKAVSERLYKLCGINLTDGKEGLVKSRLLKRLRHLGLENFDQYFDYLDKDKTGKELSTMVDSLTTNKTSFFRESSHFDYLQMNLFPEIAAQGGHCRIWSAGCSTGEEPYTIGMLLCEAFSNIERMNIRILATDISNQVLARASAGVYDEETLHDVPAQLRKKYFQPVQAKQPQTYKVVDKVRSLVKFARLNLMGDWPMKGPFDIIFCRNVMIYFDKPTQQELVNCFWELLRPGGHLFVGHSESLNSSGRQFRYVQPAVYMR
ncbi:MAG TPA: protein-glutamate O-methyltransferase CheR [Blastocatellia bacterium]|nr:protein-glutamate O-methyltransferase CheR [Blastocatellia bacterium]